MFEVRHKAVYPEIDATKPLLSQHGKTVLITGGNSGIGFSIAKAFATARASRIILVGRRLGKLSEAKAHLTSNIPSFQGDVDTYGCDISDTEKVQSLWDDLQKRGVTVDVMVLNAAYMGSEQTMFEKGWKHIWMQYELNVRANIVFTDYFVKQAANTQSSKFLINVSSEAINNYASTEGFRAYACTKASFTCLLQHLASELSADKIQVINFHPGILYTESASETMSEDEYPWDDGEENPHKDPARYHTYCFPRITESLPANFSVWAATNEASFLHGRFVFAGWDVNELRGLLERDGLLESPDFLKIGVKGTDRS